MNAQTILNIILSVLTLYLAYQNYRMSQKKENQRESQEMTEIRVQLQQVMSMLQDLQKDVRTSTADFRELAGRVIKIETRLEEAFKRLDKMEGDHGGKS